MLLASTAGECLGVQSALGWVDRLVREGLAGEYREGSGDEASVLVRVEGRHDAYPVDGWEPLARGAWHRDGEVVLHDACGSGFDVHVSVVLGRPVLHARWRPDPRTRLASRLLRSRFHLLSRAVLVQYPVLWWAGVHGRSPLHVGGVEVGGAAALLSGPAGVGKSTLLTAAVGDGARAVGDNLCVSDGERIWGLVEPLRSEGGSGRRMPHGRRESAWPDRLPDLTPDQLLVLARGKGKELTLLPLKREDAVRDLIASTYAAGELRRYWTFCALLAAGTGLGPAHPPVTQTAERLAGRLPCRSLELPVLSAARPSGLRTCLETSS